MHKVAGRIWVVSMLTTAIVSFRINLFGSSIGVSPVHLFSALVLDSVPFAVYSARKGSIAAHKSAMIGVLIGGLGITGASH